jgi:hypothetical protein
MAANCRHSIAYDTRYWGIKPEKLAIFVGWATLSCPPFKLQVRYGICVGNGLFKTGQLGQAAIIAGVFNQLAGGLDMFGGGLP